MKHTYHNDHSQNGGGSPFNVLTCSLLTCFLMLMLVNACTKVEAVHATKIPDTNPDTTRDVRKILDSIPDFSLFDQAYKRAAIPGGIDPAGLYTLFVPTDSAMTAAGLTSAVIGSLSPDSLAKIVKYHITYGVVSDTALSYATVSVQQNCFLETVFFSPQGTPAAGYSSYRHSLFVKQYGGLLNVNGWAVNAGAPPVKASNGYLYAINQVLQPPSRLLWDFVKTLPELSDYLAATGIIDSVYQTLDPNNFIHYSDSVLFNQIQFEAVGGVQRGTSTRPTVFAPTNTAFVNAGLPDIDAIRNYILGQIRIDTLYPNPNDSTQYVLNPIPSPNGSRILPNGGIAGVPNYFPMDSALKMHYLFNTNLQAATSVGGFGGLAYTNLLCYSDLTGSPSINNGVLNISTLNGVTNPLSPVFGAAVITPYTLQFSPTGAGLLNIKWNPAGVNDALIAHDSTQQTRQRNFWALNGVIYECDRLFLTK